MPDLVSLRTVPPEVAGCGTETFNTVSWPFFLLLQYLRMRSVEVAGGNGRTESDGEVEHEAPAEHLRLLSAACTMRENWLLWILRR